MSSESAIEWTDATWNPLTGCALVSEGCRNCYAAREAAGRLSHLPQYAGLAERRGNPPRAVFTGEIRLHHDRLTQPLRWKKPRRIFVNSMSDLFHPDVPVGFIDMVFGVMALTPHHTYQVLTKRPEHMAAYCGSAETAGRVAECILKMGGRFATIWNDDGLSGFRLQNVWLGTSVEDQKSADRRIPHLLQTPAAVRFLSCEPLLGPVDLDRGGWSLLQPLYPPPRSGPRPERIDWVIVGGESGPHARPMHPDWARSLRDQCAAEGVAFHFKQWGEWEVATDENARRNGYKGSCMPDTGEKFTWLGVDGRTANPSATYLVEAYAMARVGKKAAGRELDGRTHDEYPQVGPVAS